MCQSFLCFIAIPCAISYFFLTQRKCWGGREAGGVRKRESLVSHIVLMSEAHGEAKRGIKPVVGPRFLSPHKKELESKTERFSRAQKLY